MHRPTETITVDTRTVVRILLLITAFVGAVWLVEVLRRELVWIGVAFFLAVALDPAVTWIDKTFRAGRILATSFVFIIFVAILGLLGASFVPPLIKQTQELAQQLPHFLQQIQNSHTYAGRLIQHYDLVDRARQAQDHLLANLTTSTDTAVGIVRSVFFGLTATLTTLVLTFFMLLEGPSWVTLGWRYVPISEQSHFHRLTTKMYQVVAGYMRGNLIIAAGVAVVTAAIIGILGVPYAIPLGIWAGLTTLIPIIGGLLGLVTICGVALLTTSTTAAIILAVYFLIYIFVDSHVLRPYVYGKTIEMSPLLVMVAIVLGTTLDGIVGALVAIPAAACLGVLLSDLIGDGVTAAPLSATPHAHPRTGHIAKKS